MIKFEEEKYEKITGSDHTSEFGNFRFHDPSCDPSILHSRKLIISWFQSPVYVWGSSDFWSGIEALDDDPFDEFLEQWEQHEGEPCEDQDARDHKSL